MRKIALSFTRFITVAAAISLVVAASLSLKAFAESTPKPPGEAPAPGTAAQAQLKPARDYQGRTPVDLSNGIPFNNGTYGAVNENYEQWAKRPLVVPGLSELNYPYSEREDFISALDDNDLFMESALHNWKATTDRFPDAKTYANAAVQTMQPLYDRYVDAMKAAKGAGKNDWEKAQADARRALIEMRSTYSSLHKNVH